MSETQNNQKKIRRFEGVVASAQMDKTAVVRVDHTISHKRYGKRFRKTTKFKIHDPKNECRVGEHVLFEECRPFSKEKKWRLIKKIASKE